MRKTVFWQKNKLLMVLKPGLYATSLFRRKPQTVHTHIVLFRNCFRKRGHFYYLSCYFSQNRNIWILNNHNRRYPEILYQTIFGCDWVESAGKFQIKEHKQCGCWYHEATLKLFNCVLDKERIYEEEIVCDVGICRHSYSCLWFLIISRTAKTIHIANRYREGDCLHARYASALESHYHGNCIGKK